MQERVVRADHEGPLHWPGSPGHISFAAQALRVCNGKARCPHKCALSKEVARKDQNATVNYLLFAEMSRILSYRGLCVPRLSPVTIISVGERAWKGRFGDPTSSGTGEFRHRQVELARDGKLPCFWESCGS